MCYCGSTGTAWFHDQRLVEGAFADVVIGAGHFTKALALVRCAALALGWGDDTAVEYPLDRRYRPPDSNGRPREPISALPLRLGPAALLVPAG